MESREAFDEAVRRAGGVTSLAAALGESVQTVTNWRTRGVPAVRAKAVEAHTGVSVKALRPADWRDYWPELIGTPDAPPVPATAAQEA